MRIALLLTVPLIAFAVACTSGPAVPATPNRATSVVGTAGAEAPGETREAFDSSGTGVPGTGDTATSALPSLSLWTEVTVIDEIAAQLFREASRPVHIFGLNVEEGEEFVRSGRDVLPLPPDTNGWRAEFEGDGVWIVDTGQLIYRFFEAETRFDVIHVYGSDQ